MKKRRLVLITFLSILLLLISSCTFADTEKPSLNTNKMYFYVGGTYKFTLKNASGSVTWSTANPNIATVSSKGKVKAKKKGVTTLIAKNKGKKYKCKIVVLSDKKFLSTWCKHWIEDYIDQGTSPYDKVLIAGLYINTHFQYGRAEDALDVLKKGQGTCVSANKLFVEMLKAMDFEAKIRFAANDDMSRYPAGITFMEEHRNVKVKINGKWYFTDATPGTPILYMSSKKEPVYYAGAFWGQWEVYIDKIPGHQKNN